MIRRTLALFLIIAAASSYQPKPPKNIRALKMELSAFGVESDDLPSIACSIDFTNDSSYCKATFYNPQKKPYSYRILPAEMRTVLQKLEQVSLDKLKTEYRVSRTDQPSSVMTIYAADKEYTIKDYGLNAEQPMPDIYNIVYKIR